MIIIPGIVTGLIGIQLYGSTKKIVGLNEQRKGVTWGWLSEGRSISMGFN